MESLKPIQVLFLWRLLASGGGEFWKACKPQPSKKDRTELESVGLIENHPRKASDRKGVRASMYFELSEAGWEWAANHLDAEVSPRSTAAGPILQSVMAMLKEHLDRCGTGLADFVQPVGPSENQHEVTSGPAASRITDDVPVSTPATEPDLGNASHEADRGSIDQQVLSAYEAVTKGEYGVRVYLAALRSKLNGTPAEQLDEELLRMELAGRVAIYPLDNPQEIRPEDRQAALNNSVGEPRHILYTNERPASSGRMSTQA
jgi:hypothetical protein